jgi:hypothetical protein
MQVQGKEDDAELGVYMWDLLRAWQFGEKCDDHCFQD